MNNKMGEDMMRKHGVEFKEVNDVDGSGGGKLTDVQRRDGQICWCGWK